VHSWRIYSLHFCPFNTYCSDFFHNNVTNSEKLDL
jgi:hypothetical protein